MHSYELKVLLQIYLHITEFYFFHSYCTQTNQIQTFKKTYTYLPYTCTMEYPILIQIIYLAVNFKPNQVFLILSIIRFPYFLDFQPPLDLITLSNPLNLQSRPDLLKEGYEFFINMIMNCTISFNFAYFINFTCYSVRFRG